MKLVKVKRAAVTHKNQPESKTLRTLKEVVSALTVALEALGNAHLPDVEGGTDFYEEVRRFECVLIQRALKRTAGNQAHAARLLNLKQTTLHEKIKRYDIRPETVIYHEDCAAHTNAQREPLQDT